MRLLAAVFLVLGLDADAYAQAPFSFGLSYTVSVPTNDTKRFSDDFSWRGVTLEGRKLVKENLSLGFEAGWHVFFEETDDAVSLGVADVQGAHLRYTNSFPLLVNAHHYFSRQGGVRPYLGAGVGAYIIERRLDAGPVAMGETNWHFGFAPEVGVAVPLGWRTVGLLNARWHYAVPSGDVPRQSYWSFGVGVAVVSSQRQ